MASRKNQVFTEIKLGETPYAPAAARYALDILKATDARKLDMQVVERLLRCDLLTELAPDAGFGRRGYRGDDELSPRARLEKVIATWRKKAPASATRAEIDGIAGVNLRMLGALMEFDEVDARILEFTVVMHSSPGLKELLEAFGNTTLGAIAALLSVATAAPASEVLRALRHGRAVRSGLVVFRNDDTCDVPERMRVKEGVLDLVLTPGLERETLVARFLPKAPASSLTWSDFEALREAVVTVRDLLGGALRSKMRGVNVLFYGATGSGKTELVRLVATALGTALHCASAEDSDGESLSAGSRLTSLLLGHRLLEGTGALMVFDELEDLFAGNDEGFRWPTFTPVRRGRVRGRADGISKAWFNQLLEQNPVPTVWISNDVANVDPAFLRRFSFAVEFRDPSPKQRARMLSRHLIASDRIAPTEVEAIAARHAVPAAVLERALVAARLISPTDAADWGTVERIIAPIDRLMNGEATARPVAFEAGRYSLEALNTPVDLELLSARLEGWTAGDRPGITLCLHGPPGTGKSEFVKYLAHRMGREVLYRRVSDLQSMWVGETEKAIAAAFRQAEEEGSVLLFDEADSFLRDRRGALRGWEVTQVNEFLQRLESFRGVVACTTNLVEDLDEASLRRFVFKIPFAHLRPEQAASLFERVFASSLVEPLDDGGRASLSAALARVGDLAPGDFAAAARRLAVFGVRVSVAQCVDELRAEVAVKRCATRHAMGFAAAR
jgi:transitional endoplasmic reticulum ATPase